MTEKSFPYDGTPGTFEDDWRKMGRLWLPSGPILGELNGLEVFADSTGMQVKIRDGRAWVEGQFYENDLNPVTKAIAAADPTNPRIDRVILRNDFTANQTILAVLTGTPGASPSPPGLTQSSVKHEISLAQVSVPATDTSIDASQVTDERLLIARYGQHGIRRKLADDSVTSDATVNDDDELFFWVEANEVWEFQAFLRWTGPGGGIRYVFTAPSGASGGQSGFGISVDDTTFGTEVVFGADTDAFLTLRGVVINGATAGFLRFRWAQQTSHATATTIKGNSVLLARRLA